MYDMGAAGIALKLKSLQMTGRVMMTAAHPDDEDTALIAYLARNRAASVAYYSVTRGDGGQNVIGDELAAALGVIRTEELLQARTIDGGEQFFGSAIDYGFSKTLDEAKRMWPEQQQLSDMVKAIRIFRPHIIVSRFSGTDADGHGHHQMAGYLTPLAFEAAGKVDAFPEHFKEGLQPWQPLKLYRGHGSMPDDSQDNLLSINTGEFDGIFGRSYFEIAMQSRSLHRSQEMGAAELRGPQYSRLRLISSKIGKMGKESDIFDGIDTSITGIARLHSINDVEFTSKLEKLEKNAIEALNTYNVYLPKVLLPTLAEGYQLTKELAEKSKDQAVKDILLKKNDDYAEALMAAAGIVVDPLSNVETLNPGTSATVSVNVFAALPELVNVLDAKISTPQNWMVESAAAPAQPSSSAFRSRGEQPSSAYHFIVTADDNAKPTQPYWLELEHENANFNWTDANESKTRPFARPLLQAEVKLKILGQEVHIKREVQHRFTDRIEGEIRRQIKVEPAVTLKLDSDHILIPIDKIDQPRKVSISVASNSTASISGTLKPQMPSGWTAKPEKVQIDLTEKGTMRQIDIEIVPAKNIKPGKYPIKMIFESGGKEYSLQKQTINYSHIRPHNIYTEAVITAQVAEIKVAPVKVGYIMGSGDKVPDAIRRMGIDVEMLGVNDLASGDLSRFDNIVVGIRASQTRPEMIANNSRLISYVEKGGNLIVLYQQQEYIRFGLAPYSASMTVPPGRRPRVSNLRTTDENAVVKLLEPEHMLFNFPNKIVESDWDNWVQERSLYCFTEFNERYTPLLDSFDEGEDENKGCMMYARIGKGNYLYTSMSWFRQLPAGNPGAYRIFANILSMPKND